MIQSIRDLKLLRWVVCTDSVRWSHCACFSTVSSHLHFSHQDRVTTSQPLKLLFCKTDALVAFTKLQFGASSFDRIHRCLAQCPHAPDVYGQSLTKCFAVAEGMTSVMILEMPWNPKLKFCGCMPRHVCLTERLARFRRLDFQAV